jgi:hypothetical protein
MRASEQGQRARCRENDEPSQVQIGFDIREAMQGRMTGVARGDSSYVDCAFGKQESLPSGHGAENSKKLCLESRKHLKHLSARGRFGTRRCLGSAQGLARDRDCGIGLGKSEHGALCCHQRGELVRGETCLRRNRRRRGAAKEWLAARVPGSRTLAEPMAHSGSGQRRFHQCRPAEPCSLTLSP